MTADGEWVRLADWKADPPITQALIAASVWASLTPRQRELVAACRIINDPNAEWPDKYKVQLDGIKAAPKTMKSLEAKQVIDEHGNLTIPGIYTALWNHLERDKERRSARNAS